jgi:hypothetical protein
MEGIMALRYFALAYGVVFALVGLAGFVPALAPVGPDGFARLFGLFPINAVHNLVHLVFGIWGLVAYWGATSPLLYARSVAVVYGLVTIMGLVPATMHVFGLMPVHGHDIWLHAGLAIVAAVFGWAVHERPGTHAAAH